MRLASQSSSKTLQKVLHNYTRGDRSSSFFQPGKVMIGKTIVIGGGVIGMSIAWQLLRQGYEVLVFDKGRIETGASWISGGMLCPYSETRFVDDSIFFQGMKSLALYPTFLKDLQDDSDQSIAMEGKGTLLVASSQDEYQVLQHLHQRPIDKTIEVKWLSGGEVREKEPLLTDHIVGGVWVSQESQINSRELLKALVKAILKKGGVIYENVHVEQVWKERGKALGVILDNQQRVKGDKIVIATGAWSSSLGSNIDVYPLKGQSITALIPDAIQISHIIRTPRVYLVPKQDKTLKIGATMEDVGFKQTVTIGGIQSLLKEAWYVMPIVSEFEFLEAGAALRPMTPQRTPVIQREQIEHLYTATGHGRDGVLLAPYTTQVIVELIKNS